MFVKDISNNADTLDSRDIIERIEELEAELHPFEASVNDSSETFATYEDARDWITDELTDIEDDHNEDSIAQMRELVDAAAIGEIFEAAIGDITAAIKLVALNPDDIAELQTLKALAEEGEGYASDWHHGETLIRETYFTEYAKELLAETGELPRDLPGYIVIDWDATAENLKVDYTEIDFDGVSYYIR